ncbi:MAG: YneF family protein [Erysipelotrichaceae bacterium]|jgi:uncharacterized protein YneF (UPF0154 family)|nr:YneF family protein [Erysipelotrichaceae bacterium]MBR2809472.1 YneF family protein [Erysipelotrichaceae bacterium]
MNAFLAQAIWIIAGIVIGVVIGFFVSRWYFKKQLKENPPITEKMVRAMFMQMGRKPSEAQIRAIMKTMGQEL